MPKYRVGYGLCNLKVVVVGFKVAEENSVYYKKRDIEGNNQESERMLGLMLNQAMTAGADFVSVRFMR